MFKDVQSEFVHLGDGADPQTIPKHYGAYYDVAGEMFKRFGCFKGLDEMHPNIWPLVCLLADQEKRLAELEAQVLGLQGITNTADRTDAVKPNVDMRTRAGRALKETQPVGV